MMGYFLNQILNHSHAAILDNTQIAGKVDVPQNMAHDLSGLAVVYEL